MNRNEEFTELKNELEHTPAELEYIAAKAITRVKRQKRRSIIWKTPAVSFCSLVIMFVLLVNLFPKVALAMSNVPFLKDLVSAVAFDPSLKAAVENDYYQVIGESKAQDDVTVNVDYMIVDAGHISLFFKVDAPVKEGLYRFELLDGEGSYLRAGITSGTLYEAGKLQEIQIDFIDPGITIPEELQFKIKVNVNPEFQLTQTQALPAGADTEEPADIPVYNEDDAFGAGTIYDFSFILYPDKAYSNTIDSYPINQWIEIKNQRIYLDRLDIYPSYARLFLDCDDNNSAVIFNLEVSFQDNEGNVYGTKYGSSGAVDSFDVSSIYCESSYFSEADHLTMYITGIQMTQKDKLYGEINYQEKTISNLPEGITIDRMEQKSTDLYIDLGIDTDYLSAPFSMTYYDMSGNQYNFGSMSSSYSMHTKYYVMHFKIPKYEDHKYKIRWCSTMIQYLEFPVERRIK